MELVEVVHSVEVIAVRDGGQEQSLPVEPTDVVMLEYEGGFRQWSSAEELQFRSAQTRDGADDGIIRLDRFSSGLQTRAGAGALLKALEVFRLSPTAPAARALCRAQEDRVIPNPGLLELRSFEDGWFKTQRVNQVSCPEAPALLLLHGTASSTMAAFAGLAEPSRRKAWLDLVKDNYGGVFYGFDHRTLTESPLTNAISLLECLPVGARLHILSHSRGGLVGELLCIDPATIDKLDEQLFESVAPDFSRFRELLAERRPKVERFVRVACPGRGTTLASGRLDRYLSTLLNVPGWALGAAALGATAVGAAPATPVFSALRNAWDAIHACVLALIKERCKPDVLPGLAAMLPDSPLVRLLNRPDRSTTADLTVVSADVKGGSLKQQVGLLAADLFYLEDHDYVVPTRAMYGGIRRAYARYYLHQGPDANHLRYFYNEPTYEAIRSGLLGDHSKYSQIETDQHEIPSPIKFFLHRDAGANKRPVVFVLPGAMGSTLSVDGKPTWVSLQNLVKGAFGELTLDRKRVGVRADGVMSRWYGKLCEFLSASHQVVVHPFDWRLTAVEEAERLAIRLEEVLATVDSKQPIRFLCHSMGGLVARALMVRRPDLWREVCSRPGSRIVMLGVPNLGSYAAMQMFAGKGSVINGLAAGDFVHSKEQILRVIHSFDGVIQLLPYDTHQSLGVWSANGWSGFFDQLDQEFGCKFKRITATRLNAVANAWKELEAGVDPERMVYVAGVGSNTPVGWYIRDRFLFGPTIDFQVTAEGDGTVPWARGKLPGVPMFYAEASHGNLPSHRPAFEGYLQLLNDGWTQGRGVEPTQPPARRLRSGPELEYDDVPLTFLTQRELEAAVLGAQDVAPLDQQPDTRVRVGVTHGDLGYAAFPVALGCYHKQPIEGSERALDYKLGGHLSLERACGVYPWRLESSRRYLLPDPDGTGAFKGGILIGLGQFGALKQTQLVKTVRQAVVEFLLEGRATTVGGGLSFVAIGSMEGGIGLEGSISCILNGVLEAKQVLASAGASDDLRHIEFIELYEDRAIAAAHVARQLCQGEKLGGMFEFSGEVRTVSGRLSRASFQRGMSKWQRLQITEEETGQLRHTLLTSLARSEVMPLPYDRQLVDGMLRQASTVPQWNPDLSRALYQLLMPYRLKEVGDSEEKVILLLDEAAARFPWELLVDGGEDRDSRPVSVRSEMIRQLASSEFRDQARPTDLFTALVVGDPVSKLAELKAAQDEARAVAQTLSAGKFQVTHLPRPDGVTVGTALLSRPYRVLHLAGHGVYDNSGEKPEAGMVIGPDMLLTPATVSQLNPCPELVFINCCHLGRIERYEQRSNELAANLATAIIRAGARAVIAAGWAVEDNSAELFARTFYQEMSKGETFGRAVLHARQATWNEYSQFNSWGAYQCYGDPEYRWSSDPGYAQSRETDPYVSPREFVRDLENLSQRAEVCQLDDYSGLLKELESLRRAAKPTWLGEERGSGRPDVLLALARAYSQLIHPLFGLSEIGQAALPADSALVSAFDLFHKAKESSLITMDDLSILLRLEMLLWFRAEQSEPTPRSIQEILDDRKGMVAICPNAKAHSRIGGGAMLAMLREAGDKTSDALLEEMRAGYQAAVELARDDDYLLDYLFLARMCQAWPAAAPELVLPALEASGSTFFEHMKAARRLFMRWVCDGAPEEELGRVLAGFEASWQRGSSPFQFRSLLELLEFCIKVRRRKFSAQDPVVIRLVKLNNAVVGWIRGAAR
ncbi:MAG: CHAT domain-containing protein [Vulcanimicrobiota bacterium]